MRTAVVVAAGLCLASFGTLSACAVGPVSEKPDTEQRLESSAAANSDDNASPGAASRPEGQSDAPSQEGASTSPATEPAEGQTQVLSEQNKDLALDDIPSEALITVDELQGLRESGEPLFILDVRSQGQYTGGHIPEARNIPAGKTFDIRMDEVPSDGRTVVLVPQLRERAAEVWQTLVDNGYDGGTIKVLYGGMTAWADDSMDVQVEEDLGC